VAFHQQNLIGPQVRRLRTVSSLSQENLVAKLQIAGWDIRGGGLSKIEAGLRRAADAELVVKASTLQCATDDLITEKFRTTRSLLKPVLRQGIDASG